MAEKKKLYPLLILLVIGVILMLYGYEKVRGEYGIHIYESSIETFSEPLQNGDVIRTDFVAPDSMKMESVGLLFVDYGNENSGGELLVSVTDQTTGELLGSGLIPVNTVREWEWQDIIFTGKRVSSGDIVEILVTAKDLPDDTVLSLVLSKDAQHPALRISADYWDPFQKLQILFSVIVLGLIVFAYFGLYFRRIRLEYLFLLVFVIMGFLFNLLIPAKLGPDEEAHLNSVYKIAERIEGWEAPADNLSLITEEEKYNGLGVEETGHDYYVTYYGWLAAHSDKSALEPHSFWGSQENPDLTYTPAAIGIVAGRAMHLSAAGIIVCGRIFAFIPVVLLLFYAIKRIPFGKEILFTITMLPTMIQEATTINADGIDIALSFALIAAVLRILYGEKEKWRFLDYGILVFTMLILCRCKYGALVPLCMLPLLIFWKKKAALKGVRDSFRSKEGAEEAILAAVCLVLPVVCILIGFFPLIHTTVHAYGETLWATHYTFSDILHDPLSILYLLASTIYHKMDFYILSLSGTYLGWLNIVLPQYLTITMLFIVLIASLPKASEHNLFPVSRRIMLFVIAFLGIGFAVGGMLIGWTDVGSDFIDGVQGRYFLPFLPLLIFALQPKCIAVSEDGSVQKNAVMASVFMQIWIITALFVRAQS